MLELKKITKIYETETITQKALNNVSISFRENEFVSILGPSGSGKTTLLNIIGGLDDYTSGDLIINGKSTKEYTDRDWDTYRNHSIGFVFQSYNLIPVMTVYENIVLPLRMEGKRIDDSYISELLDSLAITDKKNSMPMKLSGGEQQRVAIARALANKPRIILADEPTGNLDSATGDRVLELLISGIRKYGQTLIMITHNEEIAEMADRVVYMKDGKLSDR